MPISRGSSMFVYVAKRLMLMVPVLFFVASFVFFLVRLIPGDPIDFILGENASTLDRQALAESQFFNEPLTVQYLHFWKAIFSGHLGTSYFSKEPVSQLIAERYPATLELAVFAVMFTCLLSIPLGVLSALKKETWVDQACLGFSLFGISVPSFYLGPLLVLFFSIKLDWFPVSGRELPGSFFLPSLTLGAALAALMTRMTRASLLDVLKCDYVRTATSKGLSRFQVVFKHALGSALVPLVTVLGLQFGTLLAGAVVTEKIFSWPGLGSLLLEAISRRDYAVVQGCVLVMAVSYVIINLLTDVFYTYLDPRIDYS